MTSQLVCISADHAGYKWNIRDYCTLKLSVDEGSLSYMLSQNVSKPIDEVEGEEGQGVSYEGEVFPENDGEAGQNGGRRRHGRPRERFWENDGRTRENY